MAQPVHAALDFDVFHREVLPARVASPRGREAARDVRGLPPLAFRLHDGRAYRVRPDGDTLLVEPGDDAATVAVLDVADWAAFVGEMRTTAGLHYGGRVSFARGGADDLERWEPALRALFQDRPIFDPDAPWPVADPAASFAADATDGEMRAFLRATGYVHVRGVFAADEIAELVDVIERRQRTAEPGDGRSWWATTGDGRAVCCRLIYLSEREPRLASLVDDARLRRLAGLLDVPVAPLVDRSDGVSLVVKHGGVVEGLSDLPWHRDCGLGGHPVLCPGVNVGIQLDAATAASGQLCFVPGSWRASCHRADLARARAIALETAPGDCTVHLGDAMHCAPAPAAPGPGRRTLYVGFAPPHARDAIPVGHGYNDVILARVGR